VDEETDETHSERSLPLRIAFRGGRYGRASRRSRPEQGRPSLPRTLFELTHPHFRSLSAACVSVLAQTLGRPDDSSGDDDDGAATDSDVPSEEGPRGSRASGDSSPNTDESDAPARRRPFRRSSNPSAGSDEGASSGDEGDRAGSDAEDETAKSMVEAASTGGRGRTRVHRATDRDAAAIILGGGAEEEEEEAVSKADKEEETVRRGGPWRPQAPAAVSAAAAATRKHPRR